MKQVSEPANEVQLSTNPCPDVLSNKLCSGILGANKVGHFVEGGAIYSDPSGEASIQALVGQTTTEQGSKIYQIKSVEAGKTCAQVFG